MHVSHCAGIIQNPGETRFYPSSRASFHCPPPEMSPVKFCCFQPQNSIFDPPSALLRHNFTQAKSPNLGKQQLVMASRSSSSSSTVHLGACYCVHIINSDLNSYSCTRIIFLYWFFGLYQVDLYRSACSTQTGTK